MTTEIFLPIKGYEGYYEISNFGKVRSVDRTIYFSDGRIRNFKGINLRTKLTVYGYVIAPVSINKKTQHLFLHRLIATAFIPNPYNKPHVNHLNSIRSDNRIENLEWCTHQENFEHATKFGLIKRNENHFNSKLKKEDIIKIRSSNLLGCELANNFNVATSVISMIRNNKAWKDI